MRQQLTPTAALFDVRDLRCRVRIDAKGCWNWLGKRNRKTGYGELERKWRGRVFVLAHRLSYAVLVRDIPEGLTIEHKCRNRACVNPAHLEPMTLEENLRRRQVRAKPQDARQCNLF